MAKNDKALKWNKRDALALAVLITLWALFSWRFLTPNEADRVAFPEGDFSHHYYVYRAFAYRELAAGRFPLWMDCVFAGYPFQADPQSALFYPPVMANFGFHRLMGWGHFPLAALQMEALLHLLLASLLTYAFLRDEVRHRLAALTGAITFAYGGYLTSYPPLQIAILEGVVWLPLALWGARGLAHGSERRHYLAMVAALALSVLAGNPQTYVHVGYATLAYYAYRVWRARTPWRSALGRLALVGALVVGLCAVQLLPTLQYTRHSTRADIPFDESATGFPLRDVVQLILPGVVSLWQPLYVGIWSLILALWATLAGRRSERAFWIGLGVVALILSFGKHAFGFDLAYLLVPGYALFRSQERHAFLVSFALSVLAAYGSDLLLAPLSRPERRSLRVVVRLVARSLPVIFVLLLLVVILSAAGLGDFTRHSIANRLSGLFLFLAATAILLYGRWRRPRRRLVVGGLALALVVVDLFTINRPVNFAMPREPFPYQPALAAAVADETPFFRIQDDWRLPGHTACMNGLEEIYGIASIKPQKIETFIKRAPEEVRWSLLGVRYLITWRGGLERPDGTPIPAEQLYHQDEPPDVVYTYRLAGEPRFAWIIHEVWAARDGDEVFVLLNDPNFESHRVAVLQGHLPPVSPATDEAEPVTVVERTPMRIRLQTSLSSPGLLVLSQAIYPGWEVIVNGDLASLVEVNGLMPAVALPAGDADVTFRYRPTSFYLGLAVSVITLFVCCAGVVIAWLREWQRGER
ncbi:MAG: YfhO family protein [Chloroflexota bacterium]|nr:YfhO family protein [Chloroflexota bacterium]